jgi:Flp pilus assembly protein TadG
MSQISARPTVRHGAAVLEFAIVAPLVFLFVLALIELGRGLMVTHLLTKAARQGCRVGIVEGKSTSDITTAVTSALSGVGISGDSVSVQVNDGAADASTAQAGDEITVVVSAPVSSVTWVPVTRFLSGNLSGQYTLRRE